MINSLGRIAKFAVLMSLGGTALMHASQQATFHLSVVTHWGNAVLQPGDYKMSLPDEAIGQKELRVEGNGRTLYVFPLVTDTRDRGSASRLEISEVNGQYFVHGFASGVLGKEFTFYTPKKANHDSTMAKDAAISMGIN